MPKPNEETWVRLGAGAAVGHLLPELRLRVSAEGARGCRPIFLGIKVMEVMDRFFGGFLENYGRTEDVIQLGSRQAFADE